MKAVAVVLLIVLVWCQTSQSAEPPPAVTCFTDLADRPEFQLLAGKLALVITGQQTFVMLSDTSKPNVKEKTVIAKWVKAQQDCFVMFVDWRKQYNLTPALVALSDAEHSSFLNLTADLYNGKLTYGEYAKARADIRAQTQQQWAKVVQHLREQEAAADEQRRNLAMQYLLNQPLPTYTPIVPYQMPIPRTTTTNCYVMGNQMHCTTQ